MKKTVLAAGSALFAMPAWAQIDGLLQEAEWQTATPIPALVSVLPATYQAYDRVTEVLWYSAADGLHIGFRNQLPDLEQSRLRHARDKTSSLNDQNSVLIDFAGDGSVAYQFTVSNGGSVFDATVDREGNRNSDWDGQWQAATQNDAQGWTSELFIPWNVVPMPGAQAQRNLRWYFDRFDAKRGVHAGSQPYYWSGTDVLARLPLTRVTIPVNTTRLDISTYLTQQFDHVTHESDTRAGADLFWQPNSAQFLSATVNPDFGQIESDELVVNFSATETLTTEKRPFFSENQNLFGLNAARGLRVVHTRRIGAAPDRGTEGSSEILAAAKYSFQSDSVDVSTLFAQEDDSSEAEGRRYAMLRNVYKNDQWKLGWIATTVQHPSLQREARVSALDFNADLNAELRTDAFLIRSDIRQDDQTERDSGYSSRWFWRPSARWRHRLSYTRFNADLDVRDFGYVGRVNNRQLFLDSSYTDSNFSSTDATQSRSWRYWFSYDRFANGDRMPSGTTVTMENLFRSSAWFSFELEMWSAGFDDWSSNFHHAFIRGPEYDIWASARSAPLGAWKIEGEWNRYKMASVEHFTHQYIVRPIYSLNEKLAMKFELQHIASDDWLIWRANQLRSYQRRQWQLGFELNAQVNEQQEWRIKWQWYALHASGVDNYVVLNERLRRLGANEERFNKAKLALQVRYLYHLTPTTDLYAVYSRGGVRDEERDSRDQNWQSDWSDSWGNVENDTVLLKWRMAF